MCLPAAEETECMARVAREFVAEMLPKYLFAKMFVLVWRIVFPPTAVELCQRPRSLLSPAARRCSAVATKQVVFHARIVQSWCVALGCQPAHQCCFESSGGGPRVKTSTPQQFCGRAKRLEEPQLMDVFAASGSAATALSSFSCGNSRCLFVRTGDSVPRVVATLCARKEDS